MPRQPRIDLPHIARHVVQRGNDRRPCFFQDVDYLRYLSELRELAKRAGCASHVYVLMTNHVHLLLTPSQAGQVIAIMQALGRRYVHYVNDRCYRAGTLWEGRYKACPVDSQLGCRSTNFRLRGFDWAANAAIARTRYRPIPEHDRSPVIATQARQRLSVRARTGRG
ncbi:transposase [Lysobacter capsici]|uniref:transposase n=1 Tax=Lysobacter capsici TaxID=435897 RepID=UPI002FC65CBE